MNSTIDYYNRNADGYFARTAEVTFDEIYNRFLKYIPDGGRIMDLGCGSGRDVKWLCNHGYEAYGLDASRELVSKASDEYDIPVFTGLIEEWTTAIPFDGVWCCASLMHLEDSALEQFFENLKYNLKQGGVLFMSVKSGIETGLDEQGRYLRDFTEEDVHKIITRHGEFELRELWYTEDKLSRNSFRWMNVIIENTMDTEDY